MNYRKPIVLVLFPFLSLILFMACHSASKKTDKDEVKKPAPEPGGVDLKSILEYTANNGDKLNDSTVLRYRKLADSIYGANGYTAIWSNKEHWLRQADSLFAFIANSKDYGLFPSDYHYTSLQFIQRILDEDTVARKNGAIWSRADLMMTDAFLSLVKDLKQG